MHRIKDGNLLDPAGVPQQLGHVGPAWRDIVLSRKGYVQYNADGSVTFRCQAPDAQKVLLECQMFDGTRPIEKDSKGVWTITVKPDAPDIYPYAFQIDGTQVADPNPTMSL